jgi:AsmA protein
MKKLIKYSLITGGILLLLIIAAIIAVPYLLNVDALREWGERQAASRLGREVTIEDVRFSWAGPKVCLSGFSIAEAEGFGAGPFARFEAFDLKLRLLDLFRLRLSVQHVLLTNPRARIVRNEDGAFNFDDIIEHINSPKNIAPEPLAAMDPAGDGIKTPPIDLLVEEIRVDRGELFFADATIPRMGRGIACRNMSLVLRNLSLDRPLSITASLGINRDVTDVKLSGKIGPVGRTIVPGNIPFDLNLAIEPFELARLSEILGPLPVALSGVVTARETVQGSLSEGIAYHAETSLQGINVRNMDGKHLLKDFDGSFSQDGQVDLDSRMLSLTASRLEAYQAVFEASGSVTELGQAPTVALDISSNAIPLSGWDRVLPDLGPLLKLDGDLTFRGKVSGTVGKDLAADLAFVSERFEADRGPALLERSSSEALAAPPEGTGPVEPLKAPPITVTGTVSVKKGRFEKVEFSDMEARLSQRDTVFSLDDMRLTVFSGTLSGKAWADLGTLPMAYGARTSMSDVQINDAMAAVAGLGGVLYGRVSMDLSLEGKGTEYVDLEKHLSGKGVLSGGEGRFTTANLAGGAAKAASLLGIGGESGETRFEEMKASFTIENGEVKVSDMRIVTGEWSLSAGGDIGLDKSLSLTSRMTLSQEATARIPEKRRKLFPAAPDGRVQIPLRIRGTVLSPSVRLDSAAMNQAAREEVKQEIEEKTQDLKEKLQKDLGEKLKKLF